MILYENLEQENRESFLLALEDQLPSDLIRQLEFSDIGEEDRKNWVHPLYCFLNGNNFQNMLNAASIRIKRDDGAVALVTVCDNSFKIGNVNCLPRIVCKIRFHFAEEPISLRSNVMNLEFFDFF